MKKQKYAPEQNVAYDALIAANERLRTAHHTPLPWKAERGSHQTRDPQFWQCPVVHGGLRVANVAGTSKEEAEANAAFIVRAVNNHQRLINQLKACRNKLKDMMDDSEWCQPVGLLDAIDQAIAKAEAI